MIEKRILIFSTAYLPLVGGAEVAIKEITTRLPHVHFDLITARLRYTLPRTERIGNVTIHRVGLGLFLDKFLLPFWGFFVALRLEREKPYDVVWSMMASQASIAAAWMKKYFAEKKLVLTLQEGDEEEHLMRYVLGNRILYKLFIRPWHTLVFKEADVITVISNYLRARAKRVNPDVDVHIIPNGVDWKLFRREDGALRRANIREGLGIAEGEKIVVHTGRLVKKNGLDALVRAMRFLDNDIKLVLVGGGKEEDILRRIARTEGVENRVVFVGDVAHEELPPYLHMSHVFVRPSRSEGQGISFLEAMAAEVPVVATPVGGIVDFIKDGETGRLCEVDNPKDIAEKIMLMLNNNDEREYMVSCARTLVRKRYDWDNIAHDMNKKAL